jgi:hypothetical protein
VTEVGAIREAVGQQEDVLGPIPSPEEIKSETDKLDAMMKDEMDDVDEIVSKEPRI